MNSDHAHVDWLVETTAGFAGGFVSTILLHPLDVIKTRLQLDRSHSKSRIGGSFRLAKSITSLEGNVSALYRGLTPNLVGNTLSWGFYFYCYDRLQQGLIRYHSGPLRSPDYFLAAGTAGALTSAFTNPIWVLKTRMLSSSSQAPGAYKSMLSGAVSIYRNEGTRGFYRGLAPSLFGTVHGAVQFMIYEKLKKIRASSSGAQRKERTQLSNLDYITLSATAKVVAVILTYPYQVIRARLQTYNADKVYRGARDAVLQTWRLEGMGGFYRGLGPGIVRVLPNVCVTFVVYENTRYYLPGILSN